MKTQSASLDSQENDENENCHPSSTGREIDADMPDATKKEQKADDNAESSSTGSDGGKGGGSGGSGGRTLRQCCRREAQRCVNIVDGRRTSDTAGPAVLAAL